MLLCKDDEAVAIDAGTGLRRLIGAAAPARTWRRLHVLLTHFHHDHVCGLSYLPDVAGVPCEVWGPGLVAYEEPTAAILERLFAQPFSGSPAAESFTIRDVPPGPFALAGFEIRHRLQRRHSSPTLAYRLDDALAYCTDTAFDAGNVDLAEGCSVLCHEAAADDASDVSHASAADAARIAFSAGVDRLVLIHVDPLISSEDDLVAAARKLFTRSSIGHDLDQVL